uniref:Ankyrin repeat protein n=1 Tax=Marseillevirus LCMAC101 TaxID=2506602 RepID=A0A481YQV1_9VIRU|nr:MAG: ankyrin repeat protein [Marseillevirus LCMAC101]
MRCDDYSLQIYMNSYRLMELYYACKAGDLDTVVERLEEGYDVNEVYNTGNDFFDDGITHLMAAAMKGHTSVVKTLVEWGADLEAREMHGCTALMLAVYDNDQIDVAKELLKQGSDWYSVDDRGETVLDFLSEEDRQMMEDFIIDLECEKELGELDSESESDTDFY